MPLCTRLLRSSVPEAVERNRDGAGEKDDRDSTLAMGIQMMLLTFHSLGLDSHKWACCQGDQQRRWLRYQLSDVEGRVRTTGRRGRLNRSARSNRPTDRDSGRELSRDPEASQVDASSLDPGEEERQGP